MRALRGGGREGQAGAGDVIEDSPRTARLRWSAGLVRVGDAALLAEQADHLAVAVVGEATHAGHPWG